MTERGVVLDTDKEYAKVRVERNSACASCGKCGMTEGQRHVDFYARNEVGAQNGDVVSLDIPETNSAKLAFVGYFLPLVPALALMFLSVGLNWDDWLSAVLFFVGLSVGFALVALIDKLFRHKWMETPQILEILHVDGDQRSAQQQGDDVKSESDAISSTEQNDQINGQGDNKNE